MAKRNAGLLTRYRGRTVAAATCLCLAGGLAYVASSALASRPATPEVTGSVGGAAAVQQRGASGLPLPRFVSLKSGRVNVRVGPSQDHAVEWVFGKAGLPVEIIAEFGNWRRIRDYEGAEGWVYHSLLSGKRTALIAPWSSADNVQRPVLPMRRDAADESRPTAMVEHGALVRVEECAGNWCEVRAGKARGHVRQDMLWGVYPGEPVD